MLKKLFTLFTAVGIVLSCSTTKSNQNPKGQGIEGFVYEQIGNQMPSPDKPSSPGKPLQTHVFVYQLTHISQVQQQSFNPIFTYVGTKLIDSALTDGTGHFSISLPSGRYSLFVRRNNALFANIYDIENNICPVEVTANKWSEIKISVTDKAAF